MKELKTSRDNYIQMRFCLDFNNLVWNLFISEGGELEGDKFSFIIEFLNQRGHMVNFIQSLDNYFKINILTKENQIIKIF